MPDTSSDLFDHRRIDAVLFDFHGTVAYTETVERTVRLAARSRGVDLGHARTAELASAMRAAGLADGWPPRRIPTAVAEAWQNRDLSPEDHRAAFVGIAATVDSGVADLPEAMYERLLDPDGWVVYPDTVPTMRALRARGVPVAAVSNIGFDIRQHGKTMGFADLVDAWALSYELGVCKPDPAIFRHACDTLGVDPARALMVGDTAADAGAATIGCAALVLPASPAGQVHGLAAALALL